MTDRNPTRIIENWLDNDLEKNHRAITRMRAQPEDSGAALEEWARTYFAGDWLENFRDGKSDVLITDLLQSALDRVDWEYLAKHQYNKVTDHQNSFRKRGAE